MDELMKKEKQVILPEGESNDKLVDKFNCYFVDKIRNIRKNLGSDDSISVFDEPAAKTQFHCFKEIHPDFVRKNITGAS